VNRSFLALALVVACGSNVAPAPLPPAPAKAPTPLAPSVLGSLAPSAPRAPAPPPPPTPPPLPQQDDQQELTFSAADLQGEPWFAIDEALPPLSGAADGSFQVFKDGYVMERTDDHHSSAHFWPLWADKPVELFSLPTRWRWLTVDPEGESVALLAFLPQTGERYPWGDVYVWSKAKGKRRLLRTTPALRLAMDPFEWTGDGQSLALLADTPDCSWQARDEVTRRGQGPIRQRLCQRVVIVDARTGRVSYRTPAALDPHGVDTSTNALLLHTSKLGKNEHLIIGSSAGLTGEVWWRLDLALSALSPADPPSHSSPDGQFRIEADDWKTRVRTTDDRRYVVDRWFHDRPSWLGPHHVALFAYVPNGGAPLPSIVLDLATKLARPLVPEGYSLSTMSSDGAHAILSNSATHERRWAKRR
jgi:hypothetical protein